MHRDRGLGGAGRCLPGEDKSADQSLASTGHAAPTPEQLAAGIARAHGAAGPARHSWGPRQCRFGT